MMWGWNGWSWALMSFSMIAFWGLVIWGSWRDAALQQRAAGRPFQAVSARAWSEQWATTAPSGRAGAAPLRCRTRRWAWPATLRLRSRSARWPGARVADIALPTPSPEHLSTP
jgi:hypothetical protein